jgi:hypothetical protein
MRGREHLHVGNVAEGRGLPEAVRADRVRHAVVEGMTGRVIRFQSGVRLIGSTGWNSMFWFQ